MSLRQYKKYLSYANLIKIGVGRSSYFASFRHQILLQTYIFRELDEVMVSVVAAHSMCKKANKGTNKKK